MISRNKSPFTPPRAVFSKGFTLAEVLITLVIIGIIAAITVSSIIVSTQKRETVSKLKKLLRLYYAIIF